MTTPTRYDVGDHVILDSDDGQEAHVGTVVRDVGRDYYDVRLDPSLDVVTGVYWDRLTSADHNVNVRLIAALITSRNDLRGDLMALETRLVEYETHVRLMTMRLDELVADVRRLQGVNP